ncbi:MAG: diguanylate cyclase [Aestuariibacter sp.]
MNAGSTVQSQDKQIKLLKHQMAVLSDFIVRYSKVYDGAFPDIDSAVQTLRNHLKSNNNLIDVQNTISRLTGPILKNNNALQQYSLEIRNSLEGFANELLANYSNSLAVKQQVHDFISNLHASETDMPGTMSLLQSCLKRTLEVIQDLQAAEDSNATEDEKTAELHTKVSQEFKELLAQLIATNPKEKVLQELDKRLEEGLSRKELLECCLAVLRALLEEILLERKQAERYVTSLQKTLSGIGQSVDDSIEKSEQQYQIKQEHTQSLKAHMQNIDECVTTSDDLDEIKKQASEALLKMSETLAQREQADQEEQLVLMDLLSQMKSQLAILEKETESYRQRLLEQKYHSHRDPLTQVPNRNAYNERMELEFRRWKRHKQPLCIAVIDIDHFKTINDNFGHAAGDKTLQVIAQNISKCLRTTDFFARWGGEEFVVLLPQTPMDHLVKPLETIRKQIQQIPFKFRDKNVSITTSIGATTLVEGDTIGSAFERADKALYEAKHTGRNCCIIFEG